MFFTPGHYDRAAFVVPVPEPLPNATLSASFSTNDSHNLAKMLFNRVHTIRVICLKFSAPMLKRAHHHHRMKGRKEKVDLLRF